MVENGVVYVTGGLSREHETGEYRLIKVVSSI